MGRGWQNSGNCWWLGGGASVKNQLVSREQKKNYIAISEMICTKMFGAMHNVSQFSKVFILPQSINQQLYNIY